MNWFTYGNASTLNQHELECADRCEHVEEDSTLGTKYSSEKDSFGTVGIYIQCEECFEHTKEQDRTNHCFDCNELKVTTPWKWFDFYAPQGDEPIEVCSDCWDEPTHQNRRAKDRANQEHDELYYPEPSDDDDY